ncbi:MAG: extracellular solute-binding protein [Lachnospiraceae bacterium]|nr:extracellular solute-binding protein [Lachnospiraceae bacterium]
MKSKKVLALVTALTMVTSFALAGCGGNSATSEPEVKESVKAEESVKESVDTEGAKLTIFQSKTEIMAELNKLAQAYTEETGVEVEVWETTGDSYYSDLKTSLSTESGATLFSLQPGSESRELADYLDDLSGLSFINKIGAGMADTIDGKVVGIPYTVEGFGLVYDGDLVDPSTITTTDDLIKYLQESTAENALGLSQEDYFLIAHILNAPFAVQADPAQYLSDVLAGNERLADNEAFVEFAKIMEAIRANCKNPVDITYDNNCGDFATGKTAMIHQGNWCSGMFTDYDINFDMAIAPVPVLGNKKISVSVPIAWYVNLDATDAERQLAKDFLEWLYTSETGISYLMNNFNFIPVVDGMENTNLDPINQSVSAAVISGNTIPWVMSNWPAGIVSTDLAPITSEFFTSDMSGTDLLNKLNDAFVAAAK